MKPKIVSTQDVCLDPVTGLLTVDKVPILRFVNVGGTIRVQFKDCVKPRSAYRGSEFVEIPVGEFVACLDKLADSFGG